VQFGPGYWRPQSPDPDSDGRLDAEPTLVIDPKPAPTASEAGGGLTDQEGWDYHAATGGFAVSPRVSVLGLVVRNGARVSPIVGSCYCRDRIRGHVGRFDFFGTVRAASEVLMAAH
jgi:hypothetical protein